MEYPLQIYWEISQHIRVKFESSGTLGMQKTLKRMNPNLNHTTYRVKELVCQRDLVPLSSLLGNLMTQPRQMWAIWDIGNHKTLTLILIVQCPYKDIA